jgi:uncharacterized protein (TIGR02145 family)
MKPKILHTALMISMITGAMAQKPTMILTFTADNNGQHVPLNSILIENLTQGRDTTLYAPDTVLVLDYITGMEEISTFSGKVFFLSQNYPNPIEGKTTIELLLNENEKVVVTVSDVVGREVANPEFQLEQGTHSFTFYPGRESLYFLTARADQQSRTIKMFNSPTDANASGYCKLEYNGQQKTGAGEYKSGNPLNNFVFDLGDMLKFTSFTDQGERVITSSPTGDQIYYFHYTGDPCPGAPTVTDINGNVYNTVQIGNQCWIKENLKTTTYRNGTTIPNVTDDYAWYDLTTGAYVWYENDISWKDKYGALYNWFTTVDPNGLCPTGWHVPTDDEWTALTDYIGGTSSPHGNELKSCRQVNSPLGGNCNTTEHPRWEEDDWSGYNHHGFDEFGFSALPGGYRGTYGSFYDIGLNGRWWSSTEYSSPYAWHRGMTYGSGNVYRDYLGKGNGFSVRCLRDID